MLICTQLQNYNNRCKKVPWAMNYTLMLHESKEAALNSATEIKMDCYASLATFTRQRMHAQINLTSDK